MDEKVVFKTFSLIKNLALKTLQLMPVCHLSLIPLDQNYYSYGNKVLCELDIYPNERQFHLKSISVADCYLYPVIVENDYGLLHYVPDIARPYKKLPFDLILPPRQVSEKPLKFIFFVEPLSKNVRTLEAVISSSSWFSKTTVLVNLEDNSKATKLI